MCWVTSLLGQGHGSFLFLASIDLLRTRLAATVVEWKMKMEASPAARASGLHCRSMLICSNPESNYEIKLKNLTH